MPPPRKAFRPARCLVVLLWALAIAVLALGALVAWVVHYEGTAKPVISVDYWAKRRELVAAHQPVPPDVAEPVNGVPLISEAADLLRRIETDATAPVLERHHRSGGEPISERRVHADFGRAGSLGPDDRPEIEIRLSAEITGIALADPRLAEIEALLDRIAAADVFIPPGEDAPSMLLGLNMPHLGETRSLARYTAFRFREATLAGDEAGVLRRLGHLAALRRAPESGATLIEALVGIAVHHLTLSRLHDAAVEGRLTGPALAAAERHLAGVDPLDPYLRAIEGERLIVLDAVQHTHTDDGKGGGTLIEHGLSPGPKALGLLAAGRKETVELGNRYFDLAREHALTPSDPAPAAEITAIERRVENERRYVLLSYLLPAIDKAVGALQQSRAHTSLVRTHLAIERHILDHGAPPASLEALVPDYLPAVLEDPYAPDRRLRYQPLAAPDAHTRTYILYSVGADGTDDGGRLHADPEAAFTDAALKPLQPRDEFAGYDAVANPPAPLPEPPEN